MLTVEFTFVKTDQLCLVKTVLSAGFKLLPNVLTLHPVIHYNNFPVYNTMNASEDSAGFSPSVSFNKSCIFDAGLLPHLRLSYGQQL